MSDLQHITLARVPAQPWRNGGGSTCELFTWPGSGAPWKLRISVADIAQDGPFSAFDGVDRWFAVLQGAGVRLSLPQAADALLTTASAPLQFAGEAAPGCWLLDGPTRDLNLMLQRGAGQAAMLPALPGQPWVHAAPLRALFSTTALQLQVDGGPQQAVAAWSLVLSSAAAQQRWLLQSQPGATTGRALWLAFTPGDAQRQA